MTLRFIIWSSILISVSYLTGAQEDGSISKPENCHNKGSWLDKSRKYLYRFTSESDSTFVGATDSISGFRLQCDAIIEMRRKCEGYLQVSNCELSEIVPGSGAIFEDNDIGSAKLNEILSRNKVYFQFNDGHVVDNSIIVADDESKRAMNIKRAIFSALQVHMLKRGEQYSPEEPIKTFDMFGSCPTMYQKDDAGFIYTKRDITQCKTPKLSYRQTNLFSFIKTLYGGIMEDETKELVYPFESTIECKHDMDSRKLKSTTCHQRQFFKPLSYNGTEFATCMTNIRSKLELRRSPRLSKRLRKLGIDRTMAGKTEVSILFQHEEEEKIQVTKQHIENILGELVDLFSARKTTIIPEKYRGMLKLFRMSDAQVLKNVLADLWSCQGITCNKLEQSLKLDYFMDCLLDCGTDQCIETFIKSIKDGQIPQWITYMFSYDLAIHHKPKQAVVKATLELCQQTKKISCWLPLSIMINKLGTDPDEVSQQVDGAMYQTLQFVRQTIGDTCKSGVPDTLPPDQQQAKLDELILMIKVVGNIGKPVQTIFDDNSATDPSKALVSSLLKCAENSNIPEKVSKMAIMALHKMELRSTIEEKLVEILADYNRPPGVRTASFVRLVIVPSRNIMWELLGQIHSEKMDYMKKYMVSYIDNLMHNDQPDLRGLRGLWSETIRSDERPWPKVTMNMGDSRYFELSSYFKFPLVKNISGFQIEFDIVYDIGSPVVHSAILKINRFHEEKKPILELGMDIAGLETVIGALSGKTKMGIKELIGMFAKSMKAQQGGGMNNSKTVFPGFDQDIVAKLVKLFDRANYQKINIPDGILYWKLFGHEVCYLETKDIMQILVSSMMGGGQNIATKLEYMVQMLHKGVNIATARSIDIVDVIKVLPTVGGFPLNMTVHVTGTTGMALTANLDLSNLMQKKGPAELTGQVFDSGVLRFYGEITVSIPNVTSCGSKMEAHLLLQDLNKGVAHFQPMPASEEKPKHYSFDLTVDNVDNEITIGELQGKLFLIRNYVEEEIPSDPEWEATVVKCPPKIDYVLTGMKMCIHATYPNVTSSTSHAYFPLSGPFHAKLIFKRADTNAFVWSGSYEEFNTSDSQRNEINLNFNAQGKQLKREINTRLSFDKASKEMLFYLDVPEVEIDFKIHHKNDRSNTDSTSDEEFIADVNLRKSSRSLFRGYLKGNKERTLHEQDNGKSVSRVQRKTLDFEMAFLGVSTTASLYRLTDEVNQHFTTSVNVTYFCPASKPLFYRLHWSPKLAAQNGDISKYELLNDAVIESDKTTDEWTLTDKMIAAYPGQRVNLENQMVSNNTHAHRDTTITYYSLSGEQHSVHMKARVANFTDEENMKYDYYMEVSHSHLDHDYSLQGHLYGSLKNLTFTTEIERLEKANEVGTELNSDQPLVAAASASNQPRLPPKGMPPNLKCDPLTEKNLKTTLNFTMVAVPVFQERIPVGIELQWDFLLLHQKCFGDLIYNSTGAVGRNMKNTKTDFRYWLGMDNEFAMVINGKGKMPAMKKKSSVSSAEALLEYTNKDHFDFKLDFFSDLLKMSHNVNYKWSFPRSVGYTVSSYVITPLSFINYNSSQTCEASFGEHMVWGLNCEEYYFNALFDLVVNTTATSGLHVKEQGHIVSKVSFLPGKTEFDLSLDMPKGAMPTAQLIFKRGNTDHVLDINLVHPKLLNLTFSHQKTRRASIFELSWLVDLIGSSTLHHTIQWNPLLTNVGYQGIKSKIKSASTSLIQTSDVIVQNIRKPFSEMIIPCTNQTVNDAYDRYAQPIVQLVAFGTSKNNGNDTTDDDSNSQDTREKREADSEEALETVEAKAKRPSRRLFTGVSLVIAKAMKIVGNALNEPPVLMERFVKNALMPRVQEAMQTHQIDFVTPIPMFRKHYLSIPEQTPGQRYILQILKRMTSNAAKPSPTTDDVAIIYNKKYFVTFDGILVKLPDSFTADCTHLLSADFHAKSFAVLASRQGLTLITEQTSLTIDYGGNVFLNGCSSPIGLPFSNTDQSVNVIKNDTNIVVRTKYGLKISCDTEGDMCSLYVSYRHYNHSLGLLGSNDKEHGTEFRLVNGRISETVGNFVADYAVSGPDKCYNYDEAEQNGEECSNSELMAKCQEQFEEVDNQKTCATNIPSEPFLTACIEDANQCDRGDASICTHVQAYVHLCKLKSLTVNSPGMYLSSNSSIEVIDHIC